MQVGDVITDGSCKFRIRAINRKRDELVDKYVNKIGCPYKVLDDGSQWIRIYVYVPSSANMVFKNIGEVLNGYNGFMFSKLDELNEFQSIEGKWEFMLTYPDKSNTKYNRWKQPYSPYSTNITNEKIHTDYVGYNGALRRHLASEYCAFKCDSNNTWYAPIGVYSLWENNSIPCADGTQSYNNELWVRVDNV